MPPLSLTIVIPALNAAERLPSCLAAVRGADILLVDGGSVDDSRALANDAGATVLTAPRGRGNQLAAGAAAAQGAWLLFLHADTVLSANWRNTVEIFAFSPENRRKAGYFRLAFDDETPALRRIAGAANWRSRMLGLPYGDQGLLIHRDFLAQLGGYSPIPLMEDVDLVRRIGRHRLVALDAVATTSAVRYRDGAAQRVLRNLGCLALYFLGVSPARLGRLYR